MRIQPISNHYSKHYSTQNKPQIKQQNSEINFEGNFLTKKGYYLTALLAGASVARSWFPATATEEAQNVLNSSQADDIYILENAINISKMFDSDEMQEIKKSFVGKNIEIIKDAKISNTVAHWLNKERDLDRFKSSEEIFDLIYNNNVLSEIPDINTYIDDIAFDTSHNANTSREFKTKILNEYLRNSDLQKGNVKNRIAQIIANTDEEVEYKLVEKILTNKTLSTNENLLENLKEHFDVNVCINENEYFDAKQSILNLYLANPFLQANEHVNNKIGEIVTATNPNNQYLAEIILKNRLLIDDNSIAKNLTNILKTTNNNNLQILKSNYINLLLDEGLQNKFNSGEILSSLGNKIQLDFLRHIAGNETLLTNNYITNEAHNIIFQIETQDDLELAKGLISKELIANHQGFMQGLSSYIADIKNDETAYDFATKFIKEDDQTSLVALFKLLNKLVY